MAKTYQAPLFVRLGNVLTTTLLRAGVKLVGPGNYPMYLIKRYLAYNKPVVIGEFGCCTYQGAEDAGGACHRPTLLLYFHFRTAYS